MSVPARNRLATIARHLAPAHASRLALPRTSVPLISRAVFSTTAGTGTTLPSRKPLLPPQTGKDIGRLTVVCDMDEMLLHSSLTSLGATADPRSASDHLDAEAARLGKAHLTKRPEFSFAIGEGKDRELVRSSLRPGLRKFLLALSERFEPILFTSALPIYAKPLLDLVEGPALPGDQEIPAELAPIFRHRLYRSATVPAVEMDYGFVKDIRLLGRDMSRVVLLDNSVHACVHTPDNCIVVPDYLGAKDDELFERVLPLLDALAARKDVRPFLREAVRFREQMTKQGLKFPGMPIEGVDVELEAEIKADAERRKGGNGGSGS